MAYDNRSADFFVRGTARNSPTSPPYGRSAVSRRTAAAYRHIYVSNFFHPYPYLKQRGLISEEVRNHQFRFKVIVDPESDRSVFVVEHEGRRLHHPMFNRLMVNRNPNESARRYRRA
jgi:hypothetical protein